MKSLASMTALLSLLSLMMLASTKPVHTTSLDATTLDTTYHATSATLIPVDKNQLSLPFNQNQLSEPKARRDPPGFPPPGPGLNYVEYNLLNPNFRIPPFVVCPRDGNIFQDPAAGFPGGRLNPSYGGRALEPQFSADDIWAAFNQGWQHLMNAGRAGGYAPGVIPSFTAANQDFYNYAIEHWPIWLAGTRFPTQLPQDTWSIFDPAGWPDEPDWQNTRIFMYPLTIQGHFDGGSSAPQGSNEPVIAPGDYRVIFTDAGVYLGVVRFRPGLPNSYDVLPRTTPTEYLRASWLAPVDLNHVPVAAQDVEGQWNYPGVPLGVSQIPENFLPPLNVALATVLLARWDWVAHGSRPPPMPRENMADPPMVLPLLDDGTLENDPELDDQGFYHFDWNVTSVKTADPPAEAIRHMNCRNAQIAVNRTYQVSCESNQNDGSPYLDYYIAITGTGAEGYHAVGWCKGIIDNIHRYCGWNFNLVGDITCGTSNATLVTFFMDTSIRGDHVNQVQGTELYFSLRKPWDSSDNNHECIAKAIQRGSCASGGMMPTYPVVCRSKDWFDLELTEWSWSNLGSV